MGRELTDDGSRWADLCEFVFVGSADVVVELRPRGDATVVARLHSDLSPEAGRLLVSWLPEPGSGGVHRSVVATGTTVRIEPVVAGPGTVVALGKATDGTFLHGTVQVVALAGAALDVELELQPVD